MAKRRMTAKWRRALLKNLKKARAARRRKGRRGGLTRAAKKYCPKVRKSRRPSLRAALLCLLRHKKGRYTSVHKKALRRLRASKTGRKLLRKHKLGKRAKARKGRKARRRGRKAKAKRRGRKGRWSKKAKRRVAKLRRLRRKMGVKRGALKRRMGKRVRSAMARLRRLLAKRGRRTSKQKAKIVKLQKFLKKRKFAPRPVAAKRRRARRSR